jgi:hypothetical protein
MNGGGILDAPGTAAMKGLVLLINAVEAPGAPHFRATLPLKNRPRGVEAPGAAR